MSIVKPIFNSSKKYITFFQFLLEYKFNLCAAKYWITLALFLRLPVYLYIYYSLGLIQYSRFSGIPGGDTFSYFNSIENLLSNGNYAFDLQNAESYAGRMPGYGFIYLLFRLFASKIISNTLIIVVQILFSIISVYIISEIAFLVSKKKEVFYVTFLFASFSTYTSVWDFYLLTESLSTSFLIISVYFFLKFLESKKFSNLFLSGTSIAWGIFMKSYFLPVLLIYFFVLLYIFISTNFFSKTGSFFKSLFLLLSVFIIFDSAWTIRNWLRFNKIIPLQINTRAGYEYAETDILLRNFVSSWGGDVISWNPKAEIRWFDIFSGRNASRLISEKSYDENIVLPVYIYTTAYNLDSLKSLRREIISENINQFLTGNKISGADILKTSQKINYYKNCLKYEKPFIYYCVSPVKLFVKFLFHSGTYNLINIPYQYLTVTDRIIKIFYSLIYLFVLCTGIAGIILRIRKFELSFYLIITTALYFTLIFPLAFRLIEYRYWVSAYPFFLVISSDFICFTFLKIKDFFQLKGNIQHDNKN